jgi:hypothetical protein
MALPKNGHHDEIRALECRPGAEYDEETFLYFLAIERARAERSNHRVRLLLATLEPIPGRPVPIPRASAARLFKGLRLTLRDTDIMGWYEQDRVAGAVLSAPVDGPGWETSGPIEQRVGDGLRRRLPAKIAGDLRVRVVHHGPRRVGNGQDQVS